MTFDASSTIAAKRARSIVLGLVTGAACLLGTATAAQAADPTAELLFRDGRALLDAKRYDEACPKLAESQKIEPGAGTLLALALCHEGQGKTATASMELKRASELGRRNGRSDLASAAEKRSLVLESLVPHLQVRLPSDAASAGYRVKCDGEPVADVTQPMALDPGEHHIDVSADGRVSKSYAVKITGAGTIEILVDRLDDAPKAKKPRPPAPSTVAPIDPAPSQQPESRGGLQRAGGVILIGAGVLSAGAGAYFVGKGLSESGEAKRNCPTSESCEAGVADSANDRSKDSFKVGAVSIAAGAGAITLGAILYFLAPSSSEPARGTSKPSRTTARIVPSAGPGGASLGVVGTF